MNMNNAYGNIVQCAPLSTERTLEISFWFHFEQTSTQIKDVINSMKLHKSIKYTIKSDLPKVEHGFYFEDEHVVIFWPAILCNMDLMPFFFGDGFF